MKFPKKKEIRGQSKCELGLTEQASTFLPLAKKDKRQKERSGGHRGLCALIITVQTKFYKIHSHRNFKMAGGPCQGRWERGQICLGEETWKFCPLPWGLHPNLGK